MTISAGYLPEKKIVDWIPFISRGGSVRFFVVCRHGKVHSAVKKTGSRNNLLSVGNTNESVSAAGEAAALGRLGRCRGVFGRRVAGRILQNTGQRHIDIHRLTVTDNR